MTRIHEVRTRLHVLVKSWAVNGYSKIVVVVVNFQKSLISLERFFQHLAAGRKRSPTSCVSEVK